MTTKITKTELETLIREALNEQIGNGFRPVNPSTQFVKDFEEQYIERQQATIREIQRLIKDFVEVQNINFKKIKSRKLTKLAWKIEEVFEKSLSRMNRDSDD